ncbi:hypothetical protein DS831_06085 [Bombilactobacillus bombi]|uniref:DUF2313 domain-containing protein n=1 Tax=Bombilactobacillus bombi TaxID=1303590 RepID=A0A417ZEM8_9LACO|nr:putative phage tail protein [Bombilactobacillus bombi]RHW49729.1 hypothetical protein DS831_06085 [Bombilactobacillus bombi]
MKLHDYMPDYYNNVYEMEKLLSAEQIDLSTFDDLITRTLLNEFVMQTDELGISLFEDQLGINPNLDDSLETRQYNVLMHMLPPKPITIKYFRHLLKTLNIPATVNVEYAIRNLIAQAKAHDISKSQIKRLKYLLNVYMPANLTFEILTTAETELNEHMYIGAQNSTMSVALANPKLKSHTKINSSFYFGCISDAHVQLKNSGIIGANKIDLSIVRSNSVIIFGL